MLGKMFREIANPKERDQDFMKGLVSLLLWFSVGIWVIVGVALLANSYDYYYYTAAGLSLYFIGAVLMVGAAICAAVNALTQHKTQKTVLLMISLIATICGLLLCYIGFTILGHVFAAIVCFLIPALCSIFMLVNLLIKNKLGNVVKWMLFSIIALLLTYALCIAPFTGSIAVSVLLGLLTFWTPLLLYWMYMPVYPCFRPRQPAYAQPYPQDRQPQYPPYDYQPQQPAPFAAAPTAAPDAEAKAKADAQAEKLAAVEKTLNALKARLDAGEITDEEYAQEKEKLLTLF